MGIHVPTSWSVFCFHCAVDILRIERFKNGSILEEKKILIWKSLGFLTNIQGARMIGT